MAVSEIILDAEHWNSIGDFYESVLLALGAPDWHGRNLDALADFSSSNEINRVRLPISISLVNSHNVPDAVEALISRFSSLIHNLNSSPIRDLPRKHAEIVLNR